MELNSKNIVLVGPMGCGKTTAGRQLASKLNQDFFDTDHEIINKTGVSVDHIFDIEGEEGFRRRESEVLESLCDMNNIVIATGGGVVLLPQNRLVLKNAGVVVYLSSSVEQLLRRTAKSKTRPLLENSSDRQKTITEIVNARDKYYREVATIVIDTTGKKLNEVINIIMNDL
ncbi:MAG TPA: shikimate kinase [Candidatus Thioglobus sp.]|jgi:shikimate kinase (EC 2.7.1.71)|nr:shikimate kinase [Candidatus Thioglobus sp.]